MAKRRRKALAYKSLEKTNVWADGTWTVKHGQLIRPPGRPGNIAPLFKVVGEKLPYDSLDHIEKSLKNKNFSVAGVYISHDSMGAPRYIGRGTNVFTRLRSHKKAHLLELLYFSFYMVEENVHEREIETLLIRGASHLLSFNEKKKRTGISAGSVYDYEPGTAIYERHYKKGKKAKIRRR